MTNEQYDMLCALDYITINDLQDKSDRTLLYGFEKSDYSSWYYHLYIKDGKFYEWRYSGREGANKWNPGILETITFSKKMYKGYSFYVNACDYEFCVLMKSKGVQFEFNFYMREDEVKQYYGETL